MFHGRTFKAMWIYIFHLKLNLLDIYQKSALLSKYPIKNDVIS